MSGVLHSEKRGPSENVTTPFSVCEPPFRHGYSPSYEPIYNRVGALPEGALYHNLLFAFYDSSDILC